MSSTTIIFKPKLLGKYLSFKNINNNFERTIMESKPEVRPRQFNISDSSLETFVDRMFVYTEQSLSFNFNYLLALFINIEHYSFIADKPELTGSNKHISYLLKRIPELQQKMLSKQIDPLEFQKQYKQLFC